MKVSFVLPAYKRRFLREAIASILSQTYHDFEVVVVDDCSSPSAWRTSAMMSILGVGRMYTHLKKIV